MLRITYVIAIVLLAVSFLGRPAKAQESRVWIEGTSTVTAFTCVSNEVKGAVTGSQKLQVPVKTLDCGNKRMNKDLRNALRSNEYPFIQFAVHDVDVSDVADDGTLRLMTKGSLVIAGTTRDVELTLDGSRQADGRIRTTGSTPLTLTSFGIEPPTALLGLVKVHDEVVVHFDLFETPGLASAIAEERAVK